MKRKVKAAHKAEILIVDDVEMNRIILEEIIKDMGSVPILAESGKQALELVAQHSPGLILTDISMPEMDGYELCRILKKNEETKNIPVVFISAFDDPEDIVEGFSLGGEDYITKPFSIEALLRKIRAMFAMLEHRGLTKDFYDDDRLFLDFSEQSAALNGKSLILSPMEYKMLYLFCKNPKQILTRQRLLERLWDAEENYVDEHTLTTSISRIRGKIEAEGDTYIKTIYGMGYQWMGGERK